MYAPFVNYHFKKAQTVAMATHNANKYMTFSGI